LRSSEAPEEGDGEEDTCEQNDLMVFGCKDCERSGFGFQVFRFSILCEEDGCFLELGSEKGGGDRIRSRLLKSHFVTRVTLGLLQCCMYQWSCETLFQLSEASVRRLSAALTRN
jgi:hypothetical protein